MPFLLDTHVMIWYSVTPEKISPQVRAIMRNMENQIYVSSMTAWEISIKYKLGKLPEAESLYEHYQQRIIEYGFTELPFYNHHALLAGRLEFTHKDPFDRALAAQALSNKLTLLSEDDIFKTFASLDVRW
jgi:PIN domain nuclease of toxin-antitoxin system